ncbi:MAG: sulfatase-like hydrolase/transferase, partial [Verrucomicrobiota bacterium]|nr:sulfatase-like hydrolase/transferase [Verrucomicrobiota bacterium]
MKSKLLHWFFLCAFHILYSGDRPNVVFILADDLGYGDVKAFGGKKSKVPTPHFDQLCRDGMKFTNAHVTNSVCVPSRTS